MITLIVCFSIGCKHHIAIFDENRMLDTGSRDLAGLLSEFSKQNTWKTVVNGNYLSPRICNLAERLVDIAPNCMMPIKKLEYSVLACHQLKPCNLTGQSDEAFGGFIGLVIRVMMSKWRDLADSEKLLAQVLRKAIEL